MRKQSLPRAVSLVLATTMMMLTLGAIDRLAMSGSPALQMAANATQTTKAGTPAPRSVATPRT